MRNMNEGREIIPLIEFKEEVKNETVKMIMNKILAVDTFMNKEELYYHCITALQNFGCMKDKVESILTKRISDFDRKQFNKSYNYIILTYNPKKQPKNKVFSQYFRFLHSYIKEEDLFYSFGNKTLKIEIQELQYYLYRLTDLLVKKGGYQSVARKYFMTGFKLSYKKETGRTIYPNKIAAMNKILNAYKLIQIYNQKKIKNLFVIGENNPYYHIKGVSIPDFNEIKDYCIVEKIPLVKQKYLNNKMKEELQNKTEIIINQEKMEEQIVVMKKDLMEITNENIDFLLRISSLQELTSENTMLIDFGSPYFNEVK